MDESELLADFVEESREHLGDVEIQLLQIEAMGKDIDDGLVNTVFRGIHSIKGAAGFLALTQVNAVAHSLENVLGKVREKQLIPDPYNVDVMLKGADRLKNLIASIATSNDTDNREICDRLDALLEATPPAIAETEHADSVEAESNVEMESPAKKVGEKKKATRKPSTRKTAASKATTSKTTQRGSAASKTPAPKRTRSTTRSTANKKTNTAKSTGKSANERTVERVEASLDEIESKVAESVATPAVSPPAAAAAPAPAAASRDKPSNDSSVVAPRAPAIESTIRVGVRVLDRLMNLAGELVLSRNQLMQAIAGDSSRNTDKRSSSLDAIASGLDQVTTELQETIMQTRMQPIGNVFNKFPRVIRDLSASLGKSIVLQTEGNEVETDKTIVEAIADPLTHLIRNSCDHGIEQPEVREAAGKPRDGSVVLRAYHQAGKVMIEIVDDGAGIDPERLKAKAIDKGILNSETASRMSDRDAVNLIFAPGFSTAAEVTAVSGRGVGMDVVRTNIEKIGGSVEVRSTLGRGSTVAITLPLTLAIVPSMIVAIGERRYALPQSGIVELVRTDGKEKCVQKASGAEVLRLRGKLLPLVRLREVLSMSKDDATEPNTDDCQLVVLESGRHKFALAVDRVLDSEEIVVKPLGRHLSQLSLLAGSTILGDGRVALILDTAGIASRIALSGEVEADSNASIEASTTAEQSDSQRLVLLSVSQMDRFAVSMDIVSRIERVAIDAIEAVGDQKMLQYRGIALPLVSIDDVVKVAGVDQTDHVYVIVFRVYGHEVGLLAPHLNDIRDCDLSMGVQESNDPGVAGTTVIDQRPTRLLDLYGLTEKARPEWFRQNTEEEAKHVRILVCEDSAFFRTFLTRTLTDEGHQVTACEHGEEGWATLSERPGDFDLLLTDVEMPELNGFELTTRARQDGRFNDLPIIALTSLADEESTRLGKLAGVNDYQVKMNKPELLASIKRLTDKHTNPTNPKVSA